MIGSAEARHNDAMEIGIGSARPMLDEVQRGKPTGGFTIIELSMVIAIIGIMAAILLPSLARSREAARRAQCMANLSQIGMALRIYADESRGALPWSGGENNARCLFPFINETFLTYESFVCPSDSSFSVRDFTEYEGDDPFDFSTSEHALNDFGLRCSYDYFGAYTEAPIVLPPPTRGTPIVPLMWDAGTTLQPEMNHVPGGSNVLWLDGSVTFMKDSEFASPNLPHAPDEIAYFDPGEALRSGRDEKPTFPLR